MSHPSRSVCLLLLCLSFGSPARAGLLDASSLAHLPFIGRFFTADGHSPVVSRAMTPDTDLSDIAVSAPRERIERDPLAAIDGLSARSRRAALATFFTLLSSHGYGPEPDDRP